MKKFLIPFALSLSVLFVIELTGIHNPVYYLSNNFYVQGYQATAQNKASNEIVIVNISDFSTDEIKDQIYILSQYNPSVIGIDYFSHKAISPDTEVVSFKNIVLPILIDSSKSTIQYSKNPFSNHAQYGFIKIYSSQLFEPFVEITKEKYPSFATKILQLHDSSRYTQLLKRGYEKEIINYSGNTTNFIYLGDLTKIKTLDALKEIKGKIVLVGYTGIDTINPTSSDNYDAHDTPKGKMFGVVMLANIIHTLMGNYITPVSVIVMVLLITLLAFLNTLIPCRLSKTKHKYWIIKTIQLFEIVIVFIISSYVIHHFNISLNYELMSFTVIIAPEITYWYTRKNS